MEGTVLPMEMNWRSNTIGDTGISVRISTIFERFLERGFNADAPGIWRKYRKRIKRPDSIETDVNTSWNGIMKWKRMEGMDQPFRMSLISFGIYKTAHLGSYRFPSPLSLSLSKYIYRSVFKKWYSCNLIPLTFVSWNETNLYFI